MMTYHYPPKYVVSSLKWSTPKKTQSPPKKTNIIMKVMILLTLFYIVVVIYMISTATTTDGLNILPKSLSLRHKDISSKPKETEVDVVTELDNSIRNLALAMFRDLQEAENLISASGDINIGTAGYTDINSSKKQYDGKADHKMFVFDNYDDEEMNPEKKVSNVLTNKETKDSDLKTVVQDENAESAKMALSSLNRQSILSYFDFFGSKRSINVRCFDQSYSLPGHSDGLILGIATGVDSKNFAIFSHSLRIMAKSTAFVVLFMEESTIRTKHVELAQKNSILIIPYKPSDLNPSFLENYDHSSLRWVLFHQLLKLNKVTLERIIKRIVVVDVANTAFQSDPLELVKVDGDIGDLSVIGDNPNLKIVECSWTSDYIRDCMKIHALLQVGNENVINSGVVLGSFSYMEALLLYMSNMLLGYDPDMEGVASDTSNFPSCERKGVDQGVLNYIVYKRLFRFQVKVRYYNEYPVINMKAAKGIRPVPSDPSTLDMPNSGELYAIIHEYDHNGLLTQHLARKYINWIDWDNVRSEWPSTEACKSYQTLDDIDLLRGRCDLSFTRAMTAASCCELCSGSRHSDGCSAFTYSEGVCYMKYCTTDEIKLALSEYESNKEFISDTLIYAKGALSAYVLL